MKKKIKYIFYSLGITIVGASLFLLMVQYLADHTRQCFIIGLYLLGVFTLGFATYGVYDWLFKDKLMYEEYENNIK